MDRAKRWARARRVVRLGREHTVELTPLGDSARLRVLDANAQTGLELELVIGPSGPLVRVRAQAVELDTVGEVAVRCEAFQVAARQNISLHAGGTTTLDSHSVRVEARVGTAVVRANDDVQLLGEHVLLNCDRQPPMPAWVQPPEPPKQVPLSAQSGDAALLSTLQDEPT